VLWEAARRIFSLWVTYVIRLSIMYGSLAAIPIFLIWLYVAWTIVLVSLETAYVHQNWWKTGSGKRREEMSPAETLLLGLEIYLLIAGRFLRGEAPLSCAGLARKLLAAEPDVKHFVDRFSSANLLLGTGKNQSALVPSRSLDAIPVRELIQTLLGAPGPGAAAPPKAFAADPALQARSLLGAILDSALAFPAGQTVADLLKRADRTEQAEDAERPGGYGAAATKWARERLAGWWRRLRRR